MGGCDLARFSRSNVYLLHIRMTDYGSAAEPVAAIRKVSAAILRITAVLI